MHLYQPRFELLVHDRPTAMQFTVAAFATTFPDVMFLKVKRI